MRTEETLSLAEQHKTELEKLGRDTLDPVVYVAWYKAGSDFTPLRRKTPEVQT